MKLDSRCFTRDCYLFRWIKATDQLSVIFQTCGTNPDNGWKRARKTKQNKKCVCSYCTPIKDKFPPNDTHTHTHITAHRRTPSSPRAIILRSSLKCKGSHLWNSLCSTNDSRWLQILQDHSATVNELAPWEDAISVMLLIQPTHPTACHAVATGC